MRHFPNATAIHSQGRTYDKMDPTVDLKTWQAFANSEDLHALYKGEVANQTGYRLHDLLFTLYYTDEGARYFRNEMQTKFKELIEGELTVEEIRYKAIAQFLTVTPEALIDDAMPLTLPLEIHETDSGLVIVEDSAHPERLPEIISGNGLQSEKTFS